MRKFVKSLIVVVFMIILLLLLIDFAKGQNPVGSTASARASATIVTVLEINMSIDSSGDHVLKATDDCVSIIDKLIVVNTSTEVNELYSTTYVTKLISDGHSETQLIKTPLYGYQPNGTKLRVVIVNYE